MRTVFTALPVLAALTLGVSGEVVAADEANAPAMHSIDVEEHLGEVIDRDLTFVDQDGKKVQLGDFLDGKRPVLLTLNYYRCPVLCNVQLNALTDTLATEMKRFDLMHEVNTRGTFLVSKACIPHLEKAQNPHILMLSPPLDMAEKWFAPHLAYSIAKFGMSLCVLGLAGELREKGIAVNALWPRTAIATAAVKNLVGGEAMMAASRTPDILADAAWLVLTRGSGEFTGNFLIDDSFLAENGVTDFDKYRVDPARDLAPDFFVPDSSIPPASLKALR